MRRDDLTEPMMTFVASCRLDGETLFLLERFTPNFDDGEVVVDEDRRIPVFPSEEAARAEIARRFPLQRGNPLTEQSTMEEIAAALEDQYAPMMKLAYDLDAARAWCKAPGPSGLSPADALDVWEFLAQIGEAPLAQRFDPMGLVALHENIKRDSGHRDHYELLLLGMNLSGIVRMAQEGRNPPEWGMTFPEMEEIWPKTDYPRLAAILETGITGFSRRIRT